MTAHDLIDADDFPMDRFTIPLMTLRETLTCGLTSRRSQRASALLLVREDLVFIKFLVCPWLSFFR
jgi:hypothetical protein